MQPGRERVELGPEMRFDWRNQIRSEPEFFSSTCDKVLFELDETYGRK